MNKKMLRTLVKSSFIPAFVLTGLIIFIGGCTSPKMLKNRGNIPPATLTPPEDTKENIDIITPTIPENNIQQGSFPDFPEVKAETIMYKVKKGDSFWKIGRMYGIGMKELAAYNNMDLKKPLNAGIVLEIPPGGRLMSNDELTPLKTQKVSMKPSPKAADIKDGVYTVKPGDSLWLVAKRYNTTINKLADTNGINKNTTLKVGQKLILPEGSKAVVKTKNEKDKSLLVNEPAKDGSLSKADNDLLSDLINNSNETGSNSESTPLQLGTDNYLPHTIKEGDNWNTISEMYGVSIANLKKANPKIASSTEPKVGSVINIPEE